MAVTPLNIFEDVRDFVYELPGTNSEDLALGISQLINPSMQDMENIVRIKENPSDGEAVMTLKSWEDISPILPWAWSKKLFIK